MIQGILYMEFRTIEVVNSKLSLKGHAEGAELLVDSGQRPGDPSVDSELRLRLSEGPRTVVNPESRPKNSKYSTLTKLALIQYRDV
jgi:hypothetical protein